MKYQMRKAMSELRALVCGWLAIALLLSGVASPAHHLSPVEAFYQQLTLENCLSSYGSQDHDTGDHNNHDCCLPNLAAAQILPLPVLAVEPATAIAPPPVEAVTWQTPATHPHQNAQAVPRGPPASLFV